MQTSARARRWRSRTVKPALGSAAFLLLAPGVVAAMTPAWLTGWEMRPGWFPLRAADLSDAFGMDKGGVSRQVQTLVDLGLVERRPAAEDRRAILLDASDEGRRRLEAMTRHRSDRFDERLSAWSDEELSEFSAQLAAYNRALSDD